MKIFNAIAVAGVVIADGLPVLNCPILGEGVGASSGYLIMSEGKLIYLPKTTPDVKSLIALIETLCDQILALTVICAAPASPSSPPVNAVAFTLIKAQLAILKGTLK